MLPETRPKTQAESELASVTQTRDLLVKQRTRLLNKIHALHNRHGIKLKKESLASKRRLMALDIGRFSALEQVELRAVRDQALSLSAAIAGLDREIEQAASAMDGYDSLVSIKGIGPRSAAVFLAGIGNVNDFESADKLAAYLGIVPRVNRSNETDTAGRITKRGNRLVRTTLVQCTLVAIRYSGYLNAFYRRIKERRGAGKAIIATARKLLTIIYQTLKNRWVFEDFTTFTRRQGPVPAGQSSLGDIFPARNGDRSSSAEGFLSSVPDQIRASGRNDVSGKAPKPRWRIGGPHTMLKQPPHPANDPAERHPAEQHHARTRRLQPDAVDRRP